MAKITQIATTASTEVVSLKEETGKSVLPSLSLNHDIYLPDMISFFYWILRHQIRSYKFIMENLNNRKLLTPPKKVLKSYKTVVIVSHLLTVYCGYPFLEATQLLSSVKNKEKQCKSNSHCDFGQLLFCEVQRVINNSDAKLDGFSMWR